MSDLLFAVPWWLVTLLAVIGIVLFINGNKSQVVKVRNLGAGLVVLAIVWSLVSYFVDTDKEKVEKATRQFIQAAVDRDWAAFQGKLAPDAAQAIGSHAPPGNAADVTAVAKAGCEFVHLKSARLQNLEIEQNKTLITVRFDILSTHESAYPVETSSWQFDWENMPGGWKLRRLQLVKLKDVSGDQLEDMMRGFVK